MDVQSDTSQAETECEMDSEEEENETADYEDKLQYPSFGLAPIKQTAQNVGLLPDNQVAGSSKGTS